MVARGCHFALTDADLGRVRALAGTEELVDFVAEEIECSYGDEWAVDTDKAWEPIHRAFSGSTFFYDFEGPLFGVVLGGESLSADDVQLAVLKTAEQVKVVDEALRGIDEAAFRKAYFKIDPSTYDVPLSEDDFAYGWENLANLKPFYERAAAAGRAVLFTAY